MISYDINRIKCDIAFLDPDPVGCDGPTWGPLGESTRCAFRCARSGARRWQGRLSSILRLKTWKTWHSKFECTEIGFPEFSSFPVFHWLVMCRCRCVFFSCFSSRGTVAKHHAPSFGPAARPRDRGIDTVAGELGLLGDDIWDEISKWCIGSIGLWWIIWLLSYIHYYIWYLIKTRLAVTCWHSPQNTWMTLSKLCCCDASSTDPKIETSHYHSTAIEYL